jgi:hypothetical protein
VIEASAETRHQTPIARVPNRTHNLDMSTTFERLEEQLGNATKYVVILTLISFGITIGSALLGLPKAVETFRGVSFALAYAFAALFTLLALGWLVSAIVRYFEQRRLR